MPKTDLVIVGFDYSSLDAKVADHAQACAERIRGKMKRTMEDIVEIGNDLLAVKEALPHGRFLPWLQAEFGWAARTARNFMSVAEWFGPKSAKFADLTICPSAAYLLASPSVSEQARMTAVERAQAGETITTSIALEILAQARKKATKKPVQETAALLVPRLLATLQRYKERWNVKEMEELSRQLRAFADSLDGKTVNEENPKRNSSRYNHKRRLDEG